MNRSVARAQALLHQLSRTLTSSSNTTMPSSFANLSQFSTCELSDALIKLGSPHGGHIPDISCFSKPKSESSGSAEDESVRLCGPAYTVRMVMAKDSSAPRLERHFVDTIENGSVVVIDVPPEAKNAVWGGLMTAGAQSRGALGVVVSGRIRDLAEHRAAGFTLFARGQSTLGQSPFTRPSEVQVPLRIAPQPDVAGAGAAIEAVDVRPGDVIVADEDGVVCVPVELVGKVEELALRGREVDARCMEDIKAGKGVQESFKTHRGK